MNISPTSIVQRWIVPVLYVGGMEVRGSGIRMGWKWGKADVRLGGLLMGIKQWKRRIVGRIGFITRG